MSNLRIVKTINSFELGVEAWRNAVVWDSQVSSWRSNSKLENLKLLHSVNLELLIKRFQVYGFINIMIITITMTMILLILIVIQSLMT